MECIDCGNYETCTDYDKEFWGEKERCKDFKNRIGETEEYRMTDNEIINAFEEISKKQNGNLSLAEQLVCAETLSLIGRLKVESKKYRNKYQSVKEEIARLYDTINRQKAEIEELNECLEITAGLNRKMTRGMPVMLKEERTKAIKEFAAEMKSEYERVNGQYIDRALDEIINDLVKEMAEEAEE